MHIKFERNCPDSELQKFMNCSESSDISEIVLSAGGFPHLEVRLDTSLLAHECVLMSEVITNRIPVFYDLRF